MSIRARTILISLAVMLVVAAGLAPYALTRLRAIARVSYGQTRDLLVREVEKAVQAKEDVWLTNALQIAGNPIVVRAMADGDRQAAINLLNEYGIRFKANTNFRNVRVHLITAQLTSFVKSWDAESWGESLDYSPAYGAVTRDWSPLVTMEYAPNGLRLKGLFPVFDEETFLGMANFEGGLNSIKRDLEDVGIEFLYLLDEAFLDIASSLSDAAAVGSYRVSQNDVDEAFLEYCRSALDLSATRESYAVDAAYITTALPVLHENGEEIGLYLVGQETGLATVVLDRNRQLISILFLVMAGLAVLLLAVQVLFLEFGVIRPVRVFTRTFGDIAEGDLSADLALSKSTYLGSLVQASDRMVETVRGFVLEVQKTSVDIEESQRLMEMELEKTLSETTDIAFQTGTTAGDVEKLQSRIDRATEAVNRIEAGVADLARRIDDQMSSVTQTTASVEQMSSSINSIAQIAKDRTASTEELIRSTEDGSQHVKQTVQIIQEVGSSVDEMLDLIDVVNDVSERTNLLAMNAAIEAAHAGDSGRGFAVVAGEIRKLAESTGESSTRITASLNALAEKIRDAVVRSDETGAAFTAISTGTGEVTESFREISSSTQELDVGSREMVAASEHLMNLAQDVQKNAEDIREAMSEIRDLVGNVSRTSETVHGHMGAIRSGSSGINLAMSKIADSSISNNRGIEKFLEELRRFSVSDEITDEQNRAIDRIHLSRLILQHAHWVIRARGHLDGTIRIDAASMTDHLACDLGTWLSGEASRTSMDAEAHQSMSEVHKLLHDVLRTIVEAGDGESEANETRFRELVEFSSTIVNGLSELRSKL